VMCAGQPPELLLSCLFMHFVLKAKAKSKAFLWSCAHGSYQNYYFPACFVAGGVHKVGVFGGNHIERCASMIYAKIGIHFAVLRSRMELLT